MGVKNLTCISPRILIAAKQYKGGTSKTGYLIHLSTVTDSKSSDRPWVKIQSAGWVKIQSARTVQRAYSCFFVK